MNDLVIIKDKDLPRGKWKVGLISKINLDDDGKVRRVTVKYKNNTDKAYIKIERAIQNVVVISPSENEEEH